MSVNFPWEILQIYDTNAGFPASSQTCSRSVLSRDMNYTPVELPTNLNSHRLINSSYTVHARALLTPFLAILNPKPRNKLFHPSSASILRSVMNEFAYRSG